MVLRVYDLVIGQGSQVILVNLLSRTTSLFSTDLGPVKALSANSDSIAVTYARFVAVWHKGRPAFFCQPQFLPLVAAFEDSRLLVAGEDPRINGYGAVSQTVCLESTMRGVRALAVKDGLVLAGGLGPRVDVFSRQERVCSLGCE